MTSIDLVGWGSSLVLLVTLIHQVRKQWRSGQSEGVSRWLFLGQIAASVGFTVYSVLVKNWVFVATNGALVVNALAGQLILTRNRRRKARRSMDEEAGQHSDGERRVGAVELSKLTRAALRSE